MENIPQQPSLESSHIPEEIPLEILSKWEKGSVNFDFLKDSLQKKGYKVLGERKILSSGFNGPLYLLTTDKGLLVEKTFIYGGEQSVGETTLGRRMIRRHTSSITDYPVRTHHSIVDFEKRGGGDVVVDWVFNEEIALQELQGIPGIPKLIAIVNDGLKGSVVEEYIDGYELSELPLNAQTADEVKKIIERIISTYREAGKRNYIYNNPTESTILINRSTKQPYLLDWYNHSHSEQIESPQVLQKGVESLKKLEEYILKGFNKTTQQ